jgi:SAM-dependent methyltransferase
MSALASLRARLRLRQRFQSPTKLKREAELRWWLDTWDAAIRAGSYYPADIFDFIDEPAADSYAGRREQIARAEVVRVLREAEIDDSDFFAGKVVVDIGPGALGFPDACPARVSIGVEPLAERFADAGLRMESPAVYLAVGAEAIPLVTASVDVVLARNSLDHVEDPRAVVREARRLLRPGGTLILNFDVGTTPTATEPHTLDHDEVRGWLSGMTIVTERVWDRSHGGDGHAVVLVATR